ncbi:uncharacterized protein LOC135948196 [Cloeon dipterum]|uniref:uncharacterized protein LOC135948196 n=1 Tax=Cloeon dipterum TaxID=197152 RepID=UPI00321F7A29
MAHCKAVLVLAATLVLVVAADDQGPDGKRKCHIPKIFQDIDQCCKPPMPLSDSYFQACMKDKRPMNATSGSEPTPPTSYQRMCLMECAFNGFKYLNGGNLNTAAIRSAFESSVNSTWKARARQSVTSCLSELKTKYQSSSVPTAPSGEKQCDGRPAFLVTCIHVKYYSTCSSNIKKSACASNLDKLVSKSYMDVFLNGDQL